MIYSIVQVAFIVSTALFIFSLYWMKNPKTARRGVFAGIAAMSIAIISTMIDPKIVNWDYISLAIVIGFVVGIPLSRVPLTAVPQRTALSHAFGGLAAKTEVEEKISIKKTKSEFRIIINNLLNFKLRFRLLICYFLGKQLKLYVQSHHFHQVYKNHL